MESKVITTFLFIFFIYIIISVSKVNKKIRFKSITLKKENFVLFLSFFILMFIPYYTKSKIYYYILSFLAFLSLYLSATSHGITDYGFTYIKGRALVISILDFKDVRICKFIDKGNLIKLSIQGNAEIIYQYYYKEDKEDIINFLKTQSIKLEF